MTRILLKISGEALMGTSGYRPDSSIIHSFLSQIKKAKEENQIAIVIGGGNLFRGKDAESLHMQRVAADHVGMLATVMNGIVLQSLLADIGIESVVYSAFSCGQMVKKYSWLEASKDIKNKIVIFVGGTGNPFFTTDSAAALRACEIGADIIYKVTKVDGIYTADPKKDPAAEKFTEISYQTYLEKKLQVMDMTAIALCEKNQIPIRVFGFFQKEALSKAIAGEKIGTLVHGGDSERRK